MTRLKFRILAGVAAGMLLGAPVYADITGSIWVNNSAAAGDATPANVPGTTPDVTFTVPGSTINFESGALYTIAEFLASGGATITSGAGAAAGTLDNTIFDFKGTVTVTNGETFTAGHDDGLTLVIGADTVISAPGPTSFTPSTGTYTGPSGDFPFEIVYGECCGAPGDLEISGLALVSTPEPGSVVLLFSMLLITGFVARKRFSRAA